jgi:hypothetical protein
MQIVTQISKKVVMAMGISVPQEFIVELHPASPSGAQSNSTGFASKVGLVEILPVGTIWSFGAQGESAFSEAYITSSTIVPNKFSRHTG